MRLSERVPVVAAVVVAGLAAGCRDPNGASAREDFWAALLNDRVEVVQRWLEAGLDPNETVAAECATPLAVAALRANEPIVDLLVRYGAQPNAPAGPTGGTALGCVAAAEDNVDIASLLIALGADVNAPDQDGVTPLMAAARAGFAGVVRVLLDSHADVHARTPAGETAVDLAQAAGRSEVVAMLVGAGARPAGRALPAGEAPPEDPTLPGIPTLLGTIEPGKTWDELRPLLDTGTLLDTTHESPTRAVELRRINGAVYRLTYERDGKTGPHRLVRITVE